MKGWTLTPLCVCQCGFVRQGLQKNWEGAETGRFDVTQKSRWQLRMREDEPQTLQHIWCCIVSEEMVIRLFSFTVYLITWLQITAATTATPQRPWENPSLQDIEQNLYFPKRITSLLHEGWRFIGEHRSNSDKKAAVSGVTCAEMMTEEHSFGQI